jgi:hypothetical protein
VSSIVFLFDAPNFTGSVSCDFISSTWTLVCSRGAQVSLSASSVSTLNVQVIINVNCKVAVTVVLRVFGDAAEVVLMLVVCGSRILSTPFFGVTLLGCDLSTS